MANLFRWIVVVVILNVTRTESESDECTTPFVKYCTCNTETTYLCKFNASEFKLTYIEPRALITPINTQQVNSTNLSLPDDFFKSVPSMSMLFIQGLRLTNLNWNSVNFQFLEITDCIILSVDPKFKNFSCNFQNFRVHDNEMSSFPSDLFTSCTDVLNIDLSAIQLETIPDLQNPCRGLRSLSIAQNRISNVSENFFHNCSLLEDVDLSGNLIKSISAKLFDVVGLRVRFLNLESNLIENIGDDAFESLELLEEVNLKSNRLNRIPSALFGRCAHLRLLQLRGNQLSSFPYNVLANCSRLKILELGDNRIASFDHQIECRSLTVIGLENNKLESLPREIFSNCRQLRAVLLEGNLFETLPPTLVSTLFNLNYVNVANNNLVHVTLNNNERLDCLRTISATGNKLTSFNFTENPAQIVNVSFNQISWLISGNTNCYVEFLDLSRNNISELPDGWTIGLQYLKMLNISHNSLTNLVQRNLILLDNLRQLNLSHNSLNYVEENTFDHMAHLISLDLRYNPIYSYDYVLAGLAACVQPENVFQVIRLISTLDSGLIDVDCSSGNRRDNLEVDCYCARNLVSIDHSSVECPPSCVCSRYKNDGKIFVDCENANLTSTPSRVPINSSQVILENNQLKELSLFSHSSWTEVGYLCLSHSLVNSVKIKDESFVKLISLNWLDLSRNAINEIEHNAFQGLSQLRRLDLSDNNLNFLPEDAFIGTTRLISLDLSFNRLNSLDWISKVPSSVTILKLSNNKITQLNPINSRSSLTHLFLNNNSIDTIYNETFPQTGNVKVIDLSYNKIKNVSFLGQLPKSVITFNASFNEITKIHLEKYQFSSNASFLDFSGNNISEVKLNVSKMNGKFINIYFRSNVVNTINITSSTEQTGIGIVKLFLENNPLNCDCKVKNVIKMINSTRKNAVLSFFDDRAICESPIFTRGVSLNRLSLKDLSCEEDFECPRGCRCYSRSEGKVSVDCAQFGLPPTARAPVAVQVLYVNGTSELNALRDTSWANLSEFYLVDGENERVNQSAMSPLTRLTNLKKVEMNDLCWCREREIVSYNLGGLGGTCKEPWPRSHCIREPNQTDWRWIECSGSYTSPPSFYSAQICDVFQYCNDDCACTLDVNYNFIMNCSDRNLTSFPSQETQVNVLDLDGNNLNVLPDISRWTNLKNLYVRNNQIDRLVGDELPVNIEEIDLDYNRIQKPSGWLNKIFRKESKVKVKVGLVGNPLICNCDNPYYTDWSLDRVTEILKNQNQVFCTNKDERKLLIDSLSCSKRDIDLILGISFGLGLLTVLSVLVALYFRHRRSIHVALLARQWCLCLLHEDSMDKEEKKFDAFLSYSSEDSSIVVDRLVPGLEKLSFKLCVHERDWLGGEFISEQIVQSVHSSRRTIIVLSDHFLKSTWATLEFKIALQQALEDRINRIIVVVPNDLPSKDQMPPDLRAFVSMNTYLLLDDPRFWDKLVYAMPRKINRGPVRRLPKEFIDLMSTPDSSSPPTSQETLT